MDHVIHARGPGVLVQELPANWTARGPRQGALPRCSRLGPGDPLGPDDPESPLRLLWLVW